MRDVRGIIDADADADDEHRGGDRVYREIWKGREGEKRSDGINGMAARQEKSFENLATLWFKFCC